MRSIPQFNNLEKEKIRAELISTARQNFVAKGLKKTSIEELTSSVGIAKSSFYAFFESKEALYLELLELEAPGIEERVWESVKTANSIREEIKCYLYAMSQEYESNLLIQRLVTHPEELQMVARRVTPEFVAAKTQRNVVPLVNFISDQQKRDRMIDTEPSVIAGVMQAALIIGVHKKDIGEEIYSKVQEIVFDAIANKLANEQDKNNY